MSIAWIVFRASILTPWLGYLCWSDAKHRRLPNAWTLGGLLAGLCVQAGFWGMTGFWDGLAAAGVCALFLLIPFLIRAAGAGDLKMLAACGAFVGLRETPFLLMAVSFAGLFVAVPMLILRKVTAARLKHVFRCLFDWRYDRADGRAAIPPKTDERVRVPFGIAIALGTWATLIMEVMLLCR
ncbi:MAG: prepilin peptidase [Victivallales bacterium]|nr:prepilin peptidase [Victivallales bacterium]